jgi:mono/diheme cytochrome c family protein
MISAKHLAGLAISLGAASVPLAATAADTWAEELYQLRCATCHGNAGQGTRDAVPATGPALKGNPFVVNGSVAAIRTVIRKGRNGQKRLYDDTYPNMPAFGDEAVSDAERLAKWLKEDLQTK